MTGPQNAVCVTDKFSSRLCERGTRGCTVEHEPYRQVENSTAASDSYVSPVDEWERERQHYGDSTAASVREEGVRALRLLSERIAGSPAAQFIHVYERTDEAYRVIHYPEKCDVCSWFDSIEKGLLDGE